MPGATDPGQPRSRTALLQEAAVGGLIILFVLVVYTALHEGGHALVGLLFGGTITSFSMSFWDLSAQVGVQGEFTDAQRGALTVAGVGLPYLAWVALISLTPRRPNATVAWLRLVASLGVVNTLLVWIVIPIMYLLGQAPGDDATNFLTRTHANPLLVSAAALVLYLVSWALLFSRAGGPLTLVAELRRARPQLAAPESLTALRAPTMVGIVVAGLAAGASIYFDRSDAAVAPTGYSLVAQADLSRRSYSSEVVHRFTLEHQATISFFLTLTDVKGGPDEIVLAGPEGVQATFLRAGVSFVAGRVTVHPRGILLEKGDYELRLTFPQSHGRVSVFTRIEAP